MSKNALERYLELDTAIMHRDLERQDITAAARLAGTNPEASTWLLGSAISNGAHADRILGDMDYGDAVWEWSGGSGGHAGYIDPDTGVWHPTPLWD